MEDQQNESSKGGAGKVTAWIGGATALVVALGGLLTAVKEFRKEDTAVAQTKTDAAAPAKAASLAAMAPETRPVSYTIEGGEGGTLVKIDNKWLWTTEAGDRYEYEQVSDDGTDTVAVFRQDPPDDTFYLRWHNAGGTAMQRTEGERWGDELKITPKKS
jgi:hypothetical protein